MPSSKSLRSALLASSAAFAAGLVACGSGESTSATTAGFGGSTSSSSGTLSTSGNTGTGGEGGLFTFTTAATGTGTSSTGTGTTSSSTGTGGPMCDPNPTSGPHVWSKNYGDAGNQYGLGVAADAAGNVLLAGSFLGTLTLGADTLSSASSSSDIFVARFAPDGTPLWAHRYGTGKDHTARGIASDTAGNAYFVGHFFGAVDFGGGGFNSVGPNFDDIFVVKLNPQGTHLWSKKYGDTNSQVARGIAVAPNGDVAAVGDFETKLDFGANALLTSVGLTDAFIAVFDGNNGAVKWAKQLGDGADQSAHAVAYDKNGNLLVTGNTTGAIDFGQGPQAVTGTTNAFVMKLSGAGTITWGKLYGTVKASGEGIGADAAGDVLVTGDHESDIDFGGGALPNSFGANVFAAKLDPTGKQIWAKSFGDDNSQHAKSLAVDAAGKVLLSGTFAGAIDFGKGKIMSGGGVDAFVAKLDTQGCAVWQKGFGDKAFQSMSAVAADAMGNAILTGSLAGSADFGGGVLSAGGDDVLLTKFGP